MEQTEKEAKSADLPDDWQEVKEGEVLIEFDEGMLAFEEVVVEGVAIDLAENVQLVQQQEPFLTAVHRYLVVNKALARRASKLTEEQLAEFRKLDLAWLVAEKKKLQNGGKVARKNIFQGVAELFIGAQAAPVNPNNSSRLASQLRKVIDEKIDSLLSKEQLAEFSKERDATRTFRRQSHARVLVASLDTHLFLTEEQRNQLETTVVEWLAKKDSDLYWMFYLQNANYVPQIPKVTLRKVLNEEQVSALNGLQTYNYSADEMEWQMLQHANNGGFIIEDEK